MSNIICNYVDKGMVEVEDEPIVSSLLILSIKHPVIFKEFQNLTVVIRKLLKENTADKGISTLFHYLQNSNPQELFNVLDTQDTSEMVEYASRWLEDLDFNESESTQWLTEEVDGMVAYVIRQENALLEKFDFKGYHEAIEVYSELANKPIEYNGLRWQELYEAVCYIVGQSLEVFCYSEVPESLLCCGELLTTREPLPNAYLGSYLYAIEDMNLY